MTHHASVTDPPQKARTVREIPLCFDPARPLETRDEFTAYYTQRDSPIAGFWKFLSARPNAKILFSGHIGEGKSTELHRLVLNHLEQEGALSVFVDAENSLDLLDKDLDHTDILFAIGSALVHYCGRDLPNEVLREFENFVVDVTKEEAQVKQYGIGGYLKLLFFEGGGKYSKETTIRTTIRQRMQPQVTRALVLVNQIIKSTRQRREDTKLVVIVDGLNRLPDEKARFVFFNFGRILASIDCGIVYTIPVSVLYAPEFQSIKDFFPMCQTLPNPHFRKNREFLRSFVLNRLARPELIDAPALDLVLDSTAGVLRDLMRVLIGASVRAMLRGADSLASEDVEKEVVEMRNDFVRSLSRLEDIEALKKVHSKGLIEGVDVATLARLIAGRYIIEYCDGVKWALHPLVEEILRQRGHIE